MLRPSLRRQLLAGAALGVFAFISSAQAEAPSNEELFRMVKAQQELIKRQQNRIKELEARTTAYERALGQTSATSRANSQALTKAQKELEQTRQALDESKRVMATRTDLDRTKAELGTQPTVSVFRVNPVIGWKAFAEINFMRPSTQNLIAFRFRDFINDTVDEQLIEHSWDVGFRAGGRYAFGNGWDAMAAYTYFRGETSQSASFSPASGDGSLSVGGFVSACCGAGPFSGSYKYRLHYDAVDVNVGYNFLAGGNLRFRAMGGLRWMRLDQKFDGEAIDPGGAEGFSAVADLWGVGPRLGLHGQWDIGGGFSVFGHIAASFLIGSDKAHTTFLNNGVPSFTESRRSNTVFTQGIDGAIGFGYSFVWSPVNTVHIKIGYRADHYFNLRSFIGGEGTPQGSVTLHGFFLKAAVTF